MADGSVVFSTELDTGGLKGALNGVGSLAKGAGKTFAAGFKGVGIALGAVTTGLGFLAKTAVSYNSSMEQYTTNFGVMLSSEAAAVERVAELREMAAKTPFGMEDLANASQTMLSFGLGAEESMVAMQQLGDISLGNKERFNSLSLAFAQVSAAGKLTGQDLLQMVNAGFNPLQTIAEKTGANLGDLKEVMAGGKGSKEFRKQLKAAQKEVKKMGDNASDGAKMLVQLGKDGAISAEMVAMAMEIETSPGGRFYNGMQKASETFSGMVSTLQDDATALVGKVFEPMTQSLTKNLLPLAQSYIKRLSDAFDSGGTEGLVTAVGDVIADALTKTAEELPSVLTLATNLLSSIGTELTNNSDKIAGGVSAALEAIATSDLPETAITSLGTLATSLITKLSSSLSDNAGDLLGGIASGINSLLEGGVTGDLLTSAINLATGLATALADNLPDTLPAIAKAIVDGIGAAISSLPELATTAGKLIDGLKVGLLGEDGTGGAVGVLAQGLIDGINSFLSSSGTQITIPDWATIIGGIKDTITGIGEAVTTTKTNLTTLFTSTWDDKITPIIQNIKAIWEAIVSAISSAITTAKEFFALGFESGPENPEAFQAENEKLLEQYELAGLMYGDPTTALLQNNGFIPPEETGFDLAEWLFPSAGAEGMSDIESQVQTAAENIAAMSDTALVEAFKNGEISYDQLVAAKFGEAASGEGEGAGEGSAISQMAQQIVSELSAGVSESTDLATALAALLATAQAAVTSSISGFRGVGYQIVAGMAAGVRAGSGILSAAVTAVINAALAAAKRAAEIQSPSRLFRDEVGLFIARGAAEGVTMGAGHLRTAVANMVNTAVPDMSRIGTQIMSASAGRNASAAMAAAMGAANFSQTNNFNVPVQTPDEFAKTMRLYATYGLQG